MDGPKGPLDLSFTNVTDVSAFRPVEDSALTNCHHLNLSHTKVTDVSAFRPVEDSAFRPVEDSALKNCHTVGDLLAHK